MWPAPARSLRARGSTPPHPNRRDERHMLPQLSGRLIRPARLAALTAGTAVLAASALAGGAQAAPLLCTQTITGAHGGVLNVAANQKLCLIGAVQDGAVNVAPLGALSVSRSTITGAVTLKGGFKTFDFC